MDACRRRFLLGRRPLRFDPCIHRICFSRFRQHWLEVLSRYVPLCVRSDQKAQLTLWTVFIIVPLFCVAIIWFYFPETNGLTLEEIGKLFGDKVAVELGAVASSDLAAGESIVIEGKIIERTDVATVGEEHMSVNGIKGDSK